MNIGLLGMGTIGSGVYEIAQGLEGVRVKRVLERRFQADYVTDNIEDIVRDPEIDVVVETMGGLHPAYEFASRSIECGKHFVTANKLLVSVYGPALLKQAREKGVAFLYGAACGGGIAYLANLAIARGIDRIVALGGILNGTTNYILDAMQRGGRDYAEALADAQALGYAERDPSSDVDGLDTMRKLVLACAVGFDAQIDPEDIPTFGISAVRAQDVAYARANGMALRLCALSERDAQGRLNACVEPVMIPASAPEAAILENVNYAWYRGESYGLMSYIGQGAGKLPTAANVLRDVRGIAAGQRYMTGEACAPAKPDNASALRDYYLRAPAGAAIPENWSAREVEADADWKAYEIAAAPDSEKHAFAKAQPGAFFAHIRRG